MRAIVLESYGAEEQLCIAGLFHTLAYRDSVGYANFSEFTRCDCSERPRVVTLSTDDYQLLVEALRVQTSDESFSPSA